MSFSDSAYIAAGQVKLLPVGFTTEAYKVVMQTPRFWTSAWVSIERVLLGVPVNLAMIILAGYPLSKTEETFKARKYYIWYFIVTMLFNGGLIPTYIIVSKTFLMNTIWSLVLPGAVQVFNVVLLMNFFRSLPKEIEESAFIDGAGQMTVMLRLYLPLSKPALATITLFSLVGHWNAWFDGLIYMNDQVNYPLQSYLQTVIANISTITLDTANIAQITDFLKVSERNLKASQLFIAIVPIIAVYPFLQKHFTTGIVLGSVKG
jgi:putative aldouronate transport system permease protein